MTRDGSKDVRSREELNAALVTTSTGNAEPAPETDDLALVRRAQAGDRAAFRKLFDLYHRRVYQMAVAMLRHPQDAHDVVQEAFVRAVKEKHPDAGAVPGIDINEFVVAKDLLLSNQPGEFTCPQCDGRGRINLGGVGTVECGRCHGEGLLP